MTGRRGGAFSSSTFVMEVLFIAKFLVEAQL